MSDQPDSDLLWSVCHRMAEDYEGYGSVERQRGEQWLPDCSMGCRHFVPLPGKLGFDWGVCVNPQSHRAGLLTFEHQGCPAFAGRDEE